MNKEVIRKYKDVFDWWLDGGKVWMRHVNGAKWYYVEDNPHWSSNEVYVQDDEYVELRKAQADGKVVQYYDSNYNEWVDGLQTGWKDYRIRPDEPTFRVGEYLREKSTGKVVRVNISGEFKGCASQFELWQPQECDEVVCWNSTSFSEQKTVLKYVGDDTWENIIPYIGQPFEDMK